MIIQTFYNEVTQSVPSTIDVAVGGILMNKMEDDAYSLIDGMTINNSQWSNERGQPKRVGGKFEHNFPYR